jgi:hypothetical protein
MSAEGRRAMSRELRDVDGYIRQWAAWSMHGAANIGWPSTSLTARMLEWRELGIRPDPVGTNVPEPAAQVVIVDRAVAKLPLLQRRAILVYYLRSEPREVQARLLKVHQGQLDRLLERARWAIRMAVEVSGNKQVQSS